MYTSEFTSQKVKNKHKYDQLQNMKYSDFL